MSNVKQNRTKLRSFIATFVRVKMYYLQMARERYYLKIRKLKLIRDSKYGKFGPKKNGILKK